MIKEIIINGVKVFVTSSGKIFKEDKKTAIRFYKNGGGYFFFNVPDLAEGKRGIVFVHRIVAKLFCENPNNYNVVNHIDGNRLNNDYTNLEWCTTSQNSKHAVMLGLHTLPKGEDCSWSKLDEKQISEIREKYKTGGYTYKSLAKEYGVSKANIQQIVTRKTWKHVP